MKGLCEKKVSVLSSSSKSTGCQFLFWYVQVHRCNCRMQCFISTLTILIYGLCCSTERVLFLTPPAPFYSFTSAPPPRPPPLSQAQSHSLDAFSEVVGSWFLIVARLILLSFSTLILSIRFQSCGGDPHKHSKSWKRVRRRVRV